MTNNSHLCAGNFRFSPQSDAANDTTMLLVLHEQTSHLALFTGTFQKFDSFHQPKIMQGKVNVSFFSGGGGGVKGF